MIKVNAGIARKVGEPAYGSRGASVNLELEVESNLINDPDGLMDRIRRLFTLARQAVDQELASGTAPAGNGRSRSGANGIGHSNGARERAATSSQLRAIRAIAERLGLDPESISRDNAGVGLDQLTLRQASALIDELKARDSQGSRR